MPTISINLKNANYDVIVEQGAFTQIAEHLKPLKISGKVAIITDSNVGPLHLSALKEQLTSITKEVTSYEIPAGEASKSLSQIEATASQMTQQGHGRQSTIIALGGGVVGDFAGFLAAIFFRGVPFIQIPTTIVSQVDSSVGGKTGVNLPEGKNLIGSFHQPNLVIIDTQLLATLPQREYQEGYAEVIKHAAIRDADMLAEIAALDALNQQPPTDLIARNIGIKAQVVEDDEHETTGVRALLNFGHTIGHGIEASVPYGTLLHGEAISLGIRAALYLSEKKSDLTASESAQVLACLAQFNLPLKLSNDIKTSVILDKLKSDKKFVSGSIRFVLLKQLGEAFVSQDIDLEDIVEAIEFLRS